MTEKKLGMYGEMPVVTVGKYTIAESTNEENCTTVWIEDTETGEGGNFSKHSFEKALEEYFNKNF